MNFICKVKIVTEEEYDRLCSLRSNNVLTTFYKPDVIAVTVRERVTQDDLIQINHLLKSDAEKMLAAFLDRGSVLRMSQTETPKLNKSDLG
jgi:hypothetical protein